MALHTSDFSYKAAKRIAYLIAGYVRKSLTEAEQNTLDAWVKVSPQNM
jgi:hypothetical protein